MENSLAVRPAAAAELDHLAQLWHEGWQDGHAHIAPDGLRRARTLQRFRARLATSIDDTFVAGPRGAPDGFFMLRGDEVYQLYAARSVRGSAFSSDLMDAAEAELARRGVTTAFLECGVGNDRAARFYEKRGWVRARTHTSRLDTEDGTFEIEIWRYEKKVRPRA